MIFLLACAPDIRDLDGDGIPDVALTDTAPEETTDTTDTTDGTTIDTGFDPHITVTDQGSGVWRIDIDSNNGVTYVDFGVPEQTNQLAGWEVSFERYFFRVNGGENGSGGVEGQVVTGQAFGDITSVPTDGWATDTEETSVFDDWYIYDTVNHVLTARDQVYLIRNPAKEAWKVQILDYYDDFGNTGFPSILLAPLATP